MTAFGGLVRDLGPHGLLSLSDQLVLYLSHHTSLLLDQTISDALGGEGWAVRRQGAFEASHALLSSVNAELGITAPEERLDLAVELFGALGHGRLAFDMNAEGGTIRGDNLHHGASHREKYENVVRMRRPVDSFAAGYGAAAASLTYPSDWGAFDADETECVARGDARCTLVLARRPERERFGTIVTRTAVEALPVEVPDHAVSARAARTAEGVGRMLAGMAADERGSVREFGVRIALVPASYVAQIAFDTMHLVEKRTPELFPVYLALLRESAQIGAFHMLGGTLSSSEWMSEHGLPARDIELRLEQLLGIARAFGWGTLWADDFIPGRSLVLRCPLSYESVYYGIRHDRTVRNRLPFLQGTALAIMQLLHRVDFRAERPMPPGLYDSLFKTGVSYRVEETRSTLRGDPFCEVVVETMAER